MGKPWIVEEISRYLSTRQEEASSLEMAKQAFLEHMKITLSYENDRYALLAMRRIACWYLKELRGARDLREGINKARSLPELISLVDNFHWSEEDSPAMLPN